MKFTKIHKILVLTNILFNLLISINSIHVGFLTSNAESTILSSEEQIKIINAFQEYSSNLSKKILLEKDISKKPENYSKLNSSYDVLFLSFQETSDKFNLDTLYKTLDPQLWTCPGTISKTGKTKIFEANVKTLVGICYKKTILQHTYIKNAAYAKINFISIGNTKTTLGICLKKLNSSDQSQFCFLGGHFDTSLDKAIELTTIKMIRKVRNYMTEQKVKDYTIYALGDLNIRLWKEIESNNVDEVLKQSIEGLNKQNYKSPLAEFDNKPIEYFAAKLKEFSNKEFKEDYLIKFCGNDNLRQLPFTYKLLGVKNDKDKELKNSDHPVSIEIFDKTGMLSQKEAHKDLKVNNYGWLDRLACIQLGADSHGCKIKDGVEKGVNYAIIPSLRQGDHMPVLGYFTIDGQSKKIKRKLK